MRFETIDPNLLQRCREGDLVAFEQLCVALQQDLYGFIYSTLRNHDDTDEVLQETLVRVYRHLPKLSDLSRFPWWVMRIALNQCHTARARSISRQTTPLEEEVEVPNERLVASASPVASPREALQRKEMMDDVEAAIQGLPPRQREAIVLFEIEQHSIKDIAQILDCSEGAVKFNIHEARKKLQQRLGQYLSRRPERQE